MIDPTIYIVDKDGHRIWAATAKAQIKRSACALVIAPLIIYALDFCADPLAELVHRLAPIHFFYRDPSDPWHSNYLLHPGTATPFDFGALVGLIELGLICWMLFAAFAIYESIRDLQLLRREESYRRYDESRFRSADPSTEKQQPMGASADEGPI